MACTTNARDARDVGGLQGAQEGVLEKASAESSPLLARRDGEAAQHHDGNARTHSKAQIKQIAKSIDRFGFTNPVLIDGGNMIIAGHGRVLAAKSLGLSDVPCLRLDSLSEADKRAYVIADNKLALNAGWDKEMLAIELHGLIEAKYDLDLTGFSIGEADIVIQDAREASPETVDASENDIPEPTGEAVTRPGDVWLLGRHRLVCGDSQDAGVFARLLDGGTADAVFTDPPYNVKIDGHVSGLGAARHREFAFASGEMSAAAFTGFLKATLGNAASACRDGAIAFVCMDWRHLTELLAAGEAVFSELKNVCVWNKTNGGMGTFYRSKHELVFVFKVGAEPHVNTFGLGDGGRYRTNVWDYAGVNTMKKERQDELAMHPTVKPVALVADAILDVTRRGAIVLDPFGGSGSTLIAAEKTGRAARLIEFDRLYCDVIVRRFEAYAGKPARLQATGEAFEDVAAARAAAEREVSDGLITRPGPSAIQKPGLDGDVGEIIAGPQMHACRAVGRQRRQGSGIRRTSATAR